jgi:hypothetical protein
MPSPFPGMNPYLEQSEVWHDFHQSLIPLLREMIADQLGPGYLVRLEEQLFIQELSADERRYFGRADIAVDRDRTAPSTHTSAAVVEAPAYGFLWPAVDVERHSYLEIRRARDRQLVTVLELLSPTNKRTGGDRDQYLAKRWKILNSDAHLVEIDLLRGGPRLPVDDLQPCDFCVFVSRVEERPRVGLWPIGLRDRLPVMPVPLRAPDPDVRLDLQAALQRVFDTARYDRYIYQGSPEPPLSPEDAAWARELLGTGGPVAK